MFQTPNTAIAVIGIDIGKNSFHVVGHDARGAIVLRQNGRVAKSKRGSPIPVGRDEGTALGSNKGIARYEEQAMTFPAEVCERRERDGGSVFPAHANTGDPNGPIEACPLMRTHAR